MQFSVDRSAFGRGVEVVQNVAETSLANPMIENVLVSASEGRVIFTGTNLSVSVQCTVPADVKVEGLVCVQAKVLANIARELPSGVVDVKVEGSRITVICGKAVLNLSCLPADDYPSFSPVVEGEQVRFPADFLKKMLRRTLFATSSEEKRYELDGVKFELTASEARFVATDGRRMSLMRRAVELGIERASVLVPTRALTEVARAFPDEGDIEMTLGERKIMFRGGDTTITSTLLNDNFPPYELILPKEPKIVFSIPRRPWLEAVRRVAVLSNEKTSLIEMWISEGTMVLKGQRQQVGDAMDEVEVGYHGEPFEVGYQAHFLNDMLKVMESEEIQIELVNPTVAGIFRPVGEPEFLHLIMPIKIEKKVEVDESSEPLDAEEELVEESDR